MDRIKTFSVMNENEQTVKDFIDIQFRQHKSFSNLVNIALFEYVSNHKDPLHEYESGTLIAPKFFEGGDIWNLWFSKLTDAEFKKWDLHLATLLSLSSDENDRRI